MRCRFFVVIHYNKSVDFIFRFESRLGNLMKENSSSSSSVCLRTAFAPIYLQTIQNAVNRRDRTFNIRVMLIIFSSENHLTRESKKKTFDAINNLAGKWCWRPWESTNFIGIASTVRQSRVLRECKFVFRPFDNFCSFVM